MLDGGSIEASLLGDIDIQEVFAEVSGLISGELMHLSGLGEDADENEQIMRQAMQQAAVKAFLAGLMIGKVSSPGNGGVVVEVPSDALEQMAINALKGGELAFTLIASEE